MHEGTQDSELAYCQDVYSHRMAELNGERNPSSIFHTALELHQYYWMEENSTQEKNPLL